MRYARSLWEFAWEYVLPHLYSPISAFFNLIQFNAGEDARAPNPLCSEVLYPRKASADRHKALRLVDVMACLQCRSAPDLPWSAVR